MTEFKCKELLITDSDSELVINIKVMDGLIRCRVYKPDLKQNEVLVNCLDFKDSPKYYGHVNCYPYSGIAVIGFETIGNEWRCMDESEFGRDIETNAD